MDNRGRWGTIADRVGLVVCLAVGLMLGLGFALSTARPVDTDMLWRTGQMADYYGSVWAADGDSRYVYPPVLAQLAGLVAPIGWPVFVTAWTMAMFAGLWAMTRRWSLPVLAVGAAAFAMFGLDSPLGSPVLGAVIGNIQPLMAAAIVIGLRWPAAWAFVVLTKIAPGIGLVWFVARGEWRNLAIACASTALVLTISLVLAPGAWADFLAFASANAGTPSPLPVVPIPLWIRVPMSVALLVWGARTDRAWVVPFAAGWSSLALYEWSWVTMAVAGLALAGPLGAPRWRRAPALTDQPMTKPHERAFDAMIEPVPMTPKTW